ncbi:hypothetical protein DCW30_29755 [Streptomyces alfalfae]|uniref:DUF3558 domain-containing protein n=1 Tax=Streptomyces alfalfae TaxID=1642299 RepID=A0ABM6H4I7_9ACTN|nr:hypothetical protein [Streptomyces alfalfae]APY90871.1 hypothetical protein A7J05_15865 [Streptomyces alfalfae]AYA21169.1 DUF3558 domain-containing protein [Streptomyces fradiae]RXX37087.1 hypothetical protein DCW30_29755 [Streptomyces alfalfae]RZM87341.1 DUF3558 domain-containing protein [Streptomyces alfalfae]
MQRKVYVPGVAALLAAVLAGCTGGSGLDDSGDSKPGDTGSTNAPAEPGKYQTLPEPCGEVEQGTLDAMLPGIAEMEDEEQREKAYEGTPTVTYDTDRRVGCRWKVESSGASHHLLVDFERVVSYDGAVSDDDRAIELYAKKLEAADLPEAPAAPPGSGAAEESGAPKTPADENKADGDKAGDGKKDDGEGDGKNGDEDGDKAGADDAGKGGEGSEGSEGSEDDGSGTRPATPPAGLEPRVLDDLGDEAFLDDALTTAASATRHRTVTVVFRTSNVIVTVEYDEQPGRRTDVPDSKEMQDKAEELAESLVSKFDE